MLNVISILSATIWKHKITCSTVESRMNWGMLRTWRSLLSLRSDRDSGMKSRKTMDLKYPESQNLQDCKSGDLGGQAVGNCRLIILSSPKWRRSSCFTQRTICDRAPSCIKTVVLSHCLDLRVRIMDSSNNEGYRWPVRVHLTCTAAISVMTTCDHQPAIAYSLTS